MRSILLGVLILTSSVHAQVSIDRFLTSPKHVTRDSIEAHHRGKTFEESEVAGYRALAVQDRLNNITIRLGYLFSDGGRLAVQTLGTVNADDSTAERFFAEIRGTLIDRLGKSFKEMSLLGTTTLAWSELGDRSVTLTKRSRAVIVTIYFSK